MKFVSKGWTAMKQHILSDDHQKMYRVWKANYQIEEAGPKANPTLGITSTTRVTFKDRVSNAQVCIRVKENNLYLH